MLTIEFIKLNKVLHKTNHIFQNALIKENQLYSFRFFHFSILLLLIHLLKHRRLNKISTITIIFFYSIFIEIWLFLPSIFKSNRYYTNIYASRFVYIRVAKIAKLTKNHGRVPHGDVTSLQRIGYPVCSNAWPVGTSLRGNCHAIKMYSSVNSIWNSMQCVLKA